MLKNTPCVFLTKQEKGVYEQGKFIPNRIFRGRIIEFVRMNNQKEIDIYKLGRFIKKDYHHSEQRWLLDICCSLQKDRLLQYQQNGDKLFLELASYLISLTNDKLFFSISAKTSVASQSIWSQVLAFPNLALKNFHVPASSFFLYCCKVCIAKDISS